MHVARRLGAIGGENDERVLLAAALAVQALRSGSVCVVLDDVADVAVRRLARGGPPQPARRRRPGRPRRPPAALGRRPRLPRPLLARRADGPLGDARAPRPTGARRPGRAGVGDRAPVPVAHRRRPARGARARPRRRTSRSSPAVRAPARRRPSPASSPRSRPPPARACASRSPPRPARPPRACRSRSTRRSPGSTARTGAVGDLQATTIHRLLGWRPGTTTRFRHDRLRRLPHDVVIVDESSMVSLPLMARLVEALRPTARLVLVGDPDQLASVEAGAVLGDLVAALPRGVVRLTHAHRYGPSLAALAEAIRLGDADATLALLRSGDEHRSLVEPADDRLSPRRTSPACAPTSRPAAAPSSTPPAPATPPPRCARSAPTASCSPTARARSASRTGPRPPSRGSPPPRASRHGAWPLGRPLLVTENDRVGRPLQRRHGRGDRRRARRCRRRVRRTRRPAPRPPVPAARRPARPRDDRPPRPGQPVRPRDAPAPAGHVPAAHPRAALHGGHPRPRARPRHRHRGRHPRRRRDDPVRRASGLREPR